MISTVHSQKTSFYTKNLFFYNERCPKCRKNQFFSNMFTFLSVIRQNFEYNLRILASFRVKTQKSMISTVHSQKTSFYTKNLFYYNERCPKCRRNQFFSNMFTFLSVIRQNFEYNLRILANFRVKTQKSTDFAHTY